MLVRASSIDDVRRAVETPAARPPGVGPYGRAPWPSGWATWPNVQQAHRLMMDRAVDNLLPYPGPSEGDGVVTVSGGQYLAGSYVALRQLRHVGCRLPVELWYFGDRGEMNAREAALFESLGVACRDIDRHPAWSGRRRKDGWEAKPFVIRHSAFRRVIWHDSDCTPALTNPEHLLHSPEFCETGAVFWPDNQWHDLPASRWAVFGMRDQGCWAFESGQMILDKAACWDALCLTDWINDHSDFYYQHLYGDKDTFCLAWRRLGRPYAMPPRRPDFSLHTLIHYDFAGRPVWLHRARDKFTKDPVKRGAGPFGKTGQWFRRNRFNPDLDLETERFRWVREYRDLWLTDENRDAMRRIERTLNYRYVIVGHGCRLMAFLPDGEFGEGAADREQSWRVVDGRLFLDGPESTTAVLSPQPDGSFAGQWVVGNRSPCMVVPLGLEKRP